MAAAFCCSRAAFCCTIDDCAFATCSANSARATLGAVRCLAAAKRSRQAVRWAFCVALKASNAGSARSSSAVFSSSSAGFAEPSCAGGVGGEVSTSELADFSSACCGWLLLLLAVAAVGSVAVCKLAAAKSMALLLSATSFLLLLLAAAGVVGSEAVCQFLSHLQVPGCSNLCFLGVQSPRVVAAGCGSTIPTPLGGIGYRPPCPKCN